MAPSLQSAILHPPSQNMEQYVAQATTQLPTLIGISLLLGLGKGGVPGLATVATAATVLTAPPDVVGGLGYAVALMVPILSMIDIYAAYLHRVALHWSTVWILLPPSFCGMGIGMILDHWMTDAGARLLVGSILLGILVLRTWKDVATVLFPSYAIEHHISGDSRDEKIERKGSDDVIDGIQKNDIEGGHDINEDDDTIKQKLVSETTHDSAIDNNQYNNHSNSNRSTTTTSRFFWAIAVGAIGGCATMLTNSMGPILNIYLLSVEQLSPQSYVGTRAMFFCFLNMGKLPMRIWGGTLGLPMLPLAVGLGLVSVLGVFLAKPIMMGMNEKTFVKLELGVVAFAGFRLCYMGMMS